MSWSALSETWHYAEKWAELRPEAEAIVSEDLRMTWRDFKRAIDAAAMTLLGAGVCPGDRVAMLSMARPEFMVTYLAANKIGAGWVGLSPKYPLPELKALLQACRPSVLIAARRCGDEDLAPLIGSLRSELDVIRTVMVIGEPLPGTSRFELYCPAGDPQQEHELRRRSATDKRDTEALLIYTSGSTGKPKGAIHTHRNLLANTSVQIAHWGLGCDSRVLLHFPINHAAASVAIGLATVVAGGCQIMHEKFDAARTLDSVRRERITEFGQAPAMFMLQLDDPLFNEKTFASVRRFIWAGAPAPVQMVERLARVCAVTGAKMLTGYGSTETAGWITYSDATADFGVLSRSAGRIHAPFELRIANEAGAEAPVGEVGEILVRGPFLMRGYLDDAQATARAIDAHGWYHSGDLAQQDGSGNIYLTGRANEMYKTGGELVHPREVEKVLEEDPAVLMAAVVDVPDPIYERVGWAYVAAADADKPSEESLRMLCRSRLANFKVPRRIFIRQALPLLANGKVDRVRLRREAVGAATAAQETVR